jgi:hypothetical protein
VRGVRCAEVGFGIPNSNAAARRHSIARRRRLRPGRRQPRHSLRQRRQRPRRRRPDRDTFGPGRRCVGRTTASVVPVAAGVARSCRSSPRLAPAATPGRQNRPGSRRNCPGRVARRPARRRPRHPTRQTVRGPANCDTVAADPARSRAGTVRPRAGVARVHVGAVRDHFASAGGAPTAEQADSAVRAGDFDGANDAIIQQVEPMNGLEHHRWPDDREQLQPVA